MQQKPVVPVATGPANPIRQFDGQGIDTEGSAAPGGIFRLAPPQHMAAALIRRVYFGPVSALWAGIGLCEARIGSLQKPNFIELPKLEQPISDRESWDVELTLGQNVTLRLRTH